MNQSPESNAPQEAAFDWAEREGVHGDVLAELGRLRRRRRSRNLVGLAAAAALLVAVGVLRYRPVTAVPELAQTQPSMVVYESSKLTLPDGSVVELQNDAELIPAYTAEIRAVTLLKGTAYFKVTKDPSRPFIVKAGAVGIRAVGTAFSVAMAKDKVDVLVSEGLVAVGRDEHPTSIDNGQIGTAMVSMGEQVSVGTSGHSGPLRVKTMSTAEMEDRLAWRVPRLEFSGTSLEEVVRMFNRHNEQQLILGDLELGNLKLSGFLRANNLPALVAMLRNQFQVEAEYRGSHEILLYRRS
jgi:transmembrane sensor|uniref:FecR family protein n=1 Tax=Cephaloticoccus sp. TaxID=1985742 RepID=UPI00404B67F7